MKSLACLALLAATALLSGCVTRGYKLADKSVPPAVPLNLTNAPPASVSAGPQSETAAESLAAPASAASATPAVTLSTVIVYHGPGSWKREAYWDEYVVSIRNPAAVPLVVTAARLHDGKNEPLPPGDHPWKLEKLSKTWWESNALRQTGTYFALGVGTAAGFGAAWAAAWGTMWGGTVSGGVATAGAVGTAAFVALPVLAGGTFYMNVRRKHQVEAEFTRRRLVLPLRLVPGQTVQGSLFFRVTPSPQRLVFSSHADDTPPRDTTIELLSLAGLHLKAPAPVAPATAAVSPGKPAPR
ncbi:MAG: hypothetical protein Q8N18_14465 [Opitutaceae bacterium]|nr:hypothetical protein [Opitutaceae bacterium]